MPSRLVNLHSDILTVIPFQYKIYLLNPNLGFIQGQNSVSRDVNKKSPEIGYFDIIQR